MKFYWIKYGLGWCVKGPIGYVGDTVPVQGKDIRNVVLVESVTEIGSYAIYTFSDLERVDTVV